jgi:DNA-binding LytR/AlgR family response regulator
MSALKIMLVDDEPLAIERLTDLLARIDGAEVASTHRTAAEALDRLQEVRPDLILIDVEMPKIDGFDFVEELSREGLLNASSAPCICFVTAYPQFAPDAFETGAIDFLCKPVRLARLEKTIERCRLTLAQRAAFAHLSEIRSELQSLREAPRASLPPLLWVHQRGQMRRVPIETLEWIGANGEYVSLHTGNQSFLYRSSITSVAEKLADFGFIRIHRSTIINDRRLAAVHSGRSGMKAVLDSGTTLTVGRKYRQAVRALQRPDHLAER